MAPDRQLDSVPDLGDPLFSIWRIAWISHQIVRNPLRLFDANMFYPEPLTLTYSDSLIVPGLMGAPLFWMGVHPVLVYNLLLLSAFVFSGVTMFLLVRALTGRVDAAMIAGAIFVLYPYRFEHYPHFALQMTMWMPLALWAMHRTMALGRLRDGLADRSGLRASDALVAVLRVVSGGLSGPACRCALAGARTAPTARSGARRRRRTRGGSGLSGRGRVPREPNDGGRTARDRVQRYSAEGTDYLKPHFRSLVYGRWSEGAS